MISLRNQPFQILSIFPTWSHLEFWCHTQQGLGWRAHLPSTKRPQGWANSGWNCLATKCRLQEPKKRLQEPQKILTHSYAFLRVFLVFLAGFLVFLRILAQPFFAEDCKLLVWDPLWEQQIAFAIIVQWEHTTAYLQVNFLLFAHPSTVTLANCKAYGLFSFNVKGVLRRGSWKSQRLFQALKQKVKILIGASHGSVARHILYNCFHLSILPKIRLGQSTKKRWSRCFRRVLLPSPGDLNSNASARRRMKYSEIPTCAW